jgi:hypothetical protein
MVFLFFDDFRATKILLGSIVILHMQSIYNSINRKGVIHTVLSVVIRKDASRPVPVISTGMNSTIAVPVTHDRVTRVVPGRPVQASEAGTSE